MTKKRILYLTNHVTLSKFEIPMLQRLGYEIYMPKKPMFDISVSVDWDLDKTLTIPKEDVNLLNEMDFYYTPATPRICEIINKYFDIAFIVVVPISFETILRHFRGAIVFRAFGTNTTYTEVFQSVFGSTVFTQIERLGNRFWFGSGYESIPPTEGRILKMRNVFLPLGLPNAQVVDRWVGNGRKLLFPCPKINTVPFFKAVYEKFLIDFKGIPYYVCGVQPIPVKTDGNVLGYLSDEAYINIYTTSSCMYYYSQIKTHIHYTPAEAIRWGLPLVYMAEGLLDTLGGENLPGRCESIKEARSKVKRLIGGDKRLAEKIRESQPVILEKFSYQYCEPIWNASMKIISDNIQREHEKSLIKISTPKIAVILPTIDKDIILRTAICLAKIICWGKKLFSEKVDVVFAYLESSSYQLEKYVKPLEELGVQLRKFCWEPVGLERIKKIYEIKDYAKYYGHKDVYYMLNDGMAYFHDCDYLLFVSNEIPGDVYTEIPYGVMVMDLLVRRKEVISDLEVTNSSLAFIRNSQFCMVTSPAMSEDVIQFAGIHEKKVNLIPYPIEMENTELKADEKITRPYMLWIIQERENNWYFYNALREYYLHGGKMKCVIYGSVNKHEKKNILNKVKAISYLRGNVEIISDIERIEMLKLVRNAKYIVSLGQVFGGDIQLYLYASHFGKRLLSHNCPSIKYMKDYLHLRMQLCNFESSDEVLEALQKLDDESQPDLEKGINYIDYTIVSDNVLVDIYKSIKFNCCF